MFESIVSSLLVRYVGEYIENIDTNSLNIAIWKGYLELFDLKLKKTAFDSFDLPVSVTHGFVGSLKIVIPWSSLDTSPVTLEISDVFFVVTPKKNVSITEEEQREQKYASKLRMLSSYESVKAQKQYEKEQAAKNKNTTSANDTFFSKLSEKILNNVQIKIQNVHARYEDLANDEQKIIFGITLSEFSIQSCDSTWTPQFISTVVDYVYKYGKMTKLCVYMNHDESLPTNASQEEFKSFMSKLISSESNRYIVLPINGELKAKLQKEGFLDVKNPKLKLDLSFDELSISLEDLQYRKLLSMIEYFSSTSNEQFSAYRPKLPPYSKPTRAEWMKYAVGTCVRSSRKNFFTWQQYEQRKKDRTLYIELYKRSKEYAWLEKLKEAEKSIFSNLERKLSYDDIILFRELAYREIEEETKKYNVLLEENKKSSSWFSWGSQIQREKASITDEDRERLYKAIGYDIHEEVASNTLPSDYVKAVVSFALAKGSISIVGHHNASPIITLSYNELSAMFSLRHDNSFLFDVRLADFDVEDNYTKSTIFKRILWRKNCDDDSKLLHISFESNPSDKKSDFALRASLQQIDIVVNIPLIQRILAVFIIPSEINLQSISTIAKRQLSSLQQQAQTQLRIALENKKSLFLHVEAKSPNFIFPQSISEKSSLVVLDLGHLLVQSEVDKSEREKRLKQQDLSVDDYYDKFKLQMADIQIFEISYDLWSKKTKPVDPLLEKVSFELQFAVCITPNASNMAKTKLKAKIPIVRLNISPAKVEYIVKLAFQTMSLISDPTGTLRSRIKKKAPMQVITPSSNSWQAFWVELTSDTLMLYHSESSARAFAAIPLNDRIILKDLPSDMSNGFYLAIPQAGREDICFQFSVSKDKYAWMEVIRSICISNKIDKIVLDINQEEEEQQLSKTQSLLLIDFQLDDFRFSIDTKSEQLTAFALKNLSLHFDMRNYDKKLKMNLESITVEDLTATAFQKYALSAGEKDNKFVEFVFVQAFNQSPYLEHSEWKHILVDSRTLFQFTLSNVHFYFDPTFLSKLILFIYAIQNIVTTNSTSRTKYYEVMLDEAKTKFKLASDEKEYERKHSWAFDGRMKNMTLQLIDYGSQFMSFAMTELNALVTSNLQKLIVKGNCGDLIAKDMADDCLYNEILGLSLKSTHSLIDFEYAQEYSTKNTEELSLPHFNKLLKLTMHSVKYVYIHRVITKMKLFFSTGPLTDALRSGSERVTSVVKKQSESYAMVKFELDFVNPLIIIPVAYDCKDKIIANLGKIHFSNYVYEEKPVAEKSIWMEQYKINLNAMNLRTFDGGITSDVVHHVDVLLGMKRALINKELDVPSFELSLSITDFNFTLSHAQYQIIFRMIDKNIYDPFGAIKKKRDISSVQAETTYEKEPPSAPVVKITSLYTFTVQKLQVQLLGGHEKPVSNRDPLAQLLLTDFIVRVTYFSDNSSKTTIDVTDVTATDSRLDSNSAFKVFIDSMYSKRKASSALHENLSISESIVEKVFQVPQSTKFLHFSYESTKNDSIYCLSMSNPKIIFVPDIVMLIRSFFANRYPADYFVKKTKRRDSIVCKTQGDMVISSNTWLGEDLHLSSTRRLIVKRNSQDEVILDGANHTVYLSNENKQPVIHIEDGMRLKLRNIHLVYEEDISLYVTRGTGSLLLAPPTQGVVHEVILPEQEVFLSRVQAMERATVDVVNGRVSVTATLGKPTIVFPEDSSNIKSRCLVIQLYCNAQYNQEDIGESGVFEMKDFSAYVDTYPSLSRSKGSNILDPVSLRLDLGSSRLEDNNLERNLTFVIDGDINARLSYQDVKMIYKIIGAYNTPATNPGANKPQTMPSTLEPIHDDVATIIDDETVDGNRSEDEDSFHDVEENESDEEEFKDAEDPESKAFSQTKDKVIVELTEAEEPTDITSLTSYVVKFKSSHATSILIVDDIRGYDVPLLDINVIQLDLKFSKIMNIIDAYLKFDISANFFNTTVADWEPIVEPWSCAIEYKRSATNNASTPFATEILVTSSDILRADNKQDNTLNISVSKSMLNTIISTYKLWREGFTNNAAVSQKFDPFIVRNHSGSKCKLNVDSKKEIEVQDMSECGLSFAHTRKAASAAFTRDILMSVDISENISPKVNIARIGKSYMFGKLNNAAVMEIEQLEGRKIVTIRSNIKLVNKTTLPWEVAIQSVSSEPRKIVAPLNVGSSVGLPLVDYTQHILVMRPSGEYENMYKWSEPINGFNLAEIIKHNASVRLLSCKNVNTQESEKSFHCVVRVQAKELHHKNAKTAIYDYIIEVSPPLAIENLLGVDLNYVLYDKTTAQSAKMEFGSGILPRGEKRFIYQANIKNSILMKLIPPGNIWQTDKLALLHSNEKMKTTSQLALMDNHARFLNIHFEYCFSGTAYREVSFYCPYWIINKTQLDLSLRQGDNIIAGVDLLNKHDNQQPLMFSFNDKGKSKLQVAVHGVLSETFSIDNPGTVSEIEIVKDKRYKIGVSISLAPGKFKRTKVVSFSSRCMIVNTSNVAVFVRQGDSSISKLVDPGRQICYYWPEVNKDQELCLNTDIALYNWSTPLRLTSLGELYVKLSAKKAKDQSVILHTNIVQEQGAIILAISIPENPPFVIVNETNYDIEISQSKLNSWTFIKKRSKLPYAFDNIFSSQTIDLHCFELQIVDLDITNVRTKEEPVGALGNGNLYYKITANGPTRIITFTEQNVIASSEEVTYLQVVAFIKSVGISLVNNQPIEIAYIYVDNMRFTFIQSTENIFFELEVMKLQLDNQKRDAPFPVILSAADKDCRFLHVSVIKSLRAENIMLFPYLSVNMQEAKFAIDYAFLMSVTDFIEKLLQFTDDEEKKAADEMLQRIDQPQITISEKEQKFYFNRLELHPIKVNLSFRYNKDPAFEVGNNAILMFLDTIGFTMVNVDDAPVKFNALILEHPFVSKNDLIDRIKLHYIRAATYELYKIIGSLDIIGNPVGLFNDLSVGVKDFFYEPATAITKSPNEFASGILKGTTSLVSRSVHGTFHAASKLSESVAKGIRTLTFDSEYIKESEKMNSSRAMDVKQGVQMGAEALVKGIQESASGVFVKPIETMSKQGALAGAVELAKGIFSVPSKNLAGIISFAQKTTEGISNTQIVHTERIRLPRVFRDDGCLLPYSAQDAFGYYIFFNMLGGKVAMEEKLLMYTSCGKSNTKVVVLTNVAIYCTKIKLVNPEWRVELADVKTITMDESSFVTITWGANQSSFSKLFTTSTATQYKVLVKDKKAGEELVKRTRQAMQYCQRNYK